MRRALFAMSLSLAAPASAVPLDLNHQGRLLDAGGAPIHGTHLVDLGLADASSGGSVTWLVDDASVPFDDGYFSLALPDVPAATFAAGDRWLAVRVDNGAELLPRVPMSAVPWAIRAGTVDAPAGCVADSTLVWSGAGWSCAPRVAPVQLANDTNTCTPARAGTLRWTGATLDLCTGGAWDVVHSSVGAIPNLALWLRADDGVVLGSGTDIASWEDQSGQLRHFSQSSAGRRPNLIPATLNGLPVVRHAASSQDTLTNATNFPAPATVIYLAKMSGPNRGRVLSGLSNNWLLGYHSGSEGDAYHEGWIIDGGGTAPAAWRMWTTVMSGSLSTIYQGRTQIASNSLGVAGPNGLSTCGHNASSEFSDADIAEILVYSRALSTAELDQIWTYLESKWQF